MPGLPTEENSDADSGTEDSSAVVPPPSKKKGKKKKAVVNPFELVSWKK